MPTWWRALAVVTDPAVTPAAVNATYDGLLARRVVYADGDPLEAVAKEWDPARYDEVLIATLPLDGVWESSRLELLLSQIRDYTGACVTHLVCDPIAAESVEPPPKWSSNELEKTTPKNHARAAPRHTLSGRDGYRGRRTR